MIKKIKEAIKQKLFCDNVHIITAPNGDEILISCGTPICSYTNDEEFERYWNDWTIVIGIHINKFRKSHGDKYISKSEWNKISVVKCDIYKSKP